MAPDIKQVEAQTFQVLSCLFDDDTASFRNNSPEDIECDGPGDEDDSFDAVLIADKLRQVADALNEDVKFKAVLQDLQQTAAQEAIDQVLSTGVDTLCQTPVGQKPEVAPELQLIKATVALGLYMKKTYPSMKQKLQSAMGTFLNQRVGCWVAQQGGWESVGAAVSQR